MSLESFDEVLDFAIDREEEANRFYMELAAKMKRPHMRKVFEDFANEELGHKAKLLGIKAGKISEAVTKKILDLQVADYLADVEQGSGIEYPQALIIAMKREKAAFKLYMDLAANIEDEALQNVFIRLANEEAKHKLRFEIEYDEVLQEN